MSSYDYQAIVSGGGAGISNLKLDPGMRFSVLGIINSPNLSAQASSTKLDKKIFTQYTGCNVDFKIINLGQPVLKLTRYIIRNIKAVTNFGEPYSPFIITGTVRDHNGNLCARRVLVYERETGLFIKETSSDSITGVYSISLNKSDIQYFLVCLDDNNSPDLNALINDKIYAV